MDERMLRLECLKIASGMREDSFDNARRKVAAVGQSDVDLIVKDAAGLYRFVIYGQKETVAEKPEPTAYDPLRLCRSILPLKVKGNAFEFPNNSYEKVMRGLGFVVKSVHEDVITSNVFMEIVKVEEAALGKDGKFMLPEYLEQVVEQ